MLAVIATSAALVFAIYLTDLGLQWVIFLSGLLVASLLAEVSRVSHSEWLLMRRTSQLASQKGKLEQMTHLHEQDAKDFAASKSRLHLLDEAMPTMVVLVDGEGRCRYHNRAFRHWLHLRPEQVNGRSMHEILGSKVYAELATAIRQSLDGQAVSCERRLTMPDGAVYHLAMEHIPQFDEKGRVTGFYLLANDLTGRGDMSVAVRHERAGVVGGAPAWQSDQDLFIDSLQQQVTGREDAGRRILSAIENGEFSLFCQLIAPLQTAAGESAHYEILIRLKEEEQFMLPPGAFFPVAEKHGLMPYLDRWVVQHVLQRAAIQSQQGVLRQGSIFFINVATATLRDPEFPAFLAAMLHEYGVAGSVLGFEVPDSEVASASAPVAEFVQQMKICGCCVSLSGFGRNGVSFDSPRGFQADFLKIDGSVILDILRDPIDLAKVAAIAKVAKKIGIRTIAEMVESEEAIEKLREAGVDFAQGFGISRPQAFIE